MLRLLLLMAKERALQLEMSWKGSLSMAEPTTAKAATVMEL